MELIVAAFTIGLVGSLHCVGMCGPIALAIPMKSKNVFARIFDSFLYNIGRSATYFVMGLIFGIFGKGIAMAGFQQKASIVIGALMILSVIFPLMFRKLNFLGKLSEKSVQFVGGRLGILFQKPSRPKLLVIGLLNGLLPCGLVYVALAGALNTGSMLEGGLFMFVFGFGTMATMLVIPVVSHLISLKIRNRLSKLIPMFIILFGMLFIARGMDLGIKFISPKFNKEEAKVEGCCSQQNQ